VDEQQVRVEYVGFWARAAASLVDTVLSAVVLSPIISALTKDTTPLPRDLSAASVEALTGALLASMTPASPVDAIVSYGLPAVAVIAFWIARQATPGKMLVHARIVDAVTLGKPGAGRMIVRYLGYYVSLLAFGLGFFWVGWDPRKQGWHDKLAGTVVVRSRRPPTH
jgi:uncharacterized RDD family membrane protein YckC